MRITRPFVLLAVVALLAPRAEASRTSVWESNPPAAAVIAKADATSALASLAPAAAADVEAAEPPRFNLGDVVLVARELEREEHFGLGPLTLVDLNLLRGPPPSYPETRVGGFELLPPFRIGASPSLRLWPRQACGFSCRGVASDSRYDPWGLVSMAFDNPYLDSGASGIEEGQTAARDSDPIRRAMPDPGCRLRGECARDAVAEAKQDLERYQSWLDRNDRDERFVQGFDIVFNVAQAFAGGRRTRSANRPTRPTTPRVNLADPKVRPSSMEIPAPPLEVRLPLEPGKTPLKEFDIDRYVTFRGQTRRGDSLAGHELLQNAWLEANGYSAGRLRDEASRSNPAVGLSPQLHEKVNAAQRSRGLWDRSVLKGMDAATNIALNVEAMREAGIPEHVVQTLRMEAAKHAATLPGRP